MRGSVRAGFVFLFVWMLGFRWVRCVAFLGCWPFLEVTVVYWRCPCAGRHLLSLHAAKKVSKESGFTPPAHKRVPWLGGGSGPSGIGALAHSAIVTKPSSVPTPHCVRRGWVCVGNQWRWSRAAGLSASPSRGGANEACWKGGGRTRKASGTQQPVAGQPSRLQEAHPPRIGARCFRDDRVGARSAAGRMTALSLRLNVRGHGFQMYHCPLQARGPA
jgi:hypothetical protein